MCKSLSSEESWGSSEEGYQYRTRYTAKPNPSADLIRSTESPAKDAKARDISPVEAVTSPLPAVKVTRSVYAEEEELVPSVPLASEDSDLGESGDFESFSDGDPVEEEEEEAGGLRTPGQNSEALNIK